MKSLMMKRVLLLLVVCLINLVSLITITITITKDAEAKLLDRIVAVIDNKIITLIIKLKILLIGLFFIL